MHSKSWGQLAVIGGAAVLTVSSPRLARAEDADADKAPSLQQALGDPEGLSVNGSIRARYETIANQFRPTRDRSSDALLLQTDIQVEYDSGPVRFGAEVMDSRAYGGGQGSSLGTGEVNALELAQAYLGFDLGEALGQGSDTRLTAGRFTMNMGSRRLIARNAFRNTTNAFTGFRLDHESAGGAKLSAFYTLPMQRLPDTRADILDNRIRADRQDFDLTFWGGFASIPLGASGAHLEAYYYGLDEGDRPDDQTRNRHLRTPGARLVREPAVGRFDFELEGAYQYGTIRRSALPDAARQDVSAWFAHGEIGYKLAGGWKPRVALEYDRASGDESGGSYNRFDTLYGARRFEFGPTSLFGALGRTNISSPGVRLELAPDKRLGLMTMYRAAWADTTDDTFSTTGVIGTAGSTGSFAGHQVEAMVRYWLVPETLQLETGGALLFNGDLLENAAGASGNGDPRYGYVSAMVRF